MFFLSLQSIVMLGSTMSAFAIEEMLQIISIFDIEPINTHNRIIILYFFILFLLLKRYFIAMLPQKPEHGIVDIANTTIINMNMQFPNGRSENT